MGTHTASKAPVFALPQDELLTLNVKDDAVQYLKGGKVTYAVEKTAKKRKPVSEPA